MKVVIVRPEMFDEVANIADHLVQGKTIVLNLETANGTINDLVVAATAKIGEKISLRRFEKVTKEDNQVFGSYLHMGGRIASLTVVEGENEEAAALREIYEETSIKAELTGDFKVKSEYTMPNGKSKTVIYFVAVYANQTPKHNDGFEHNEYMLLEYDAALNSLTFENTKEILTKANEFINNCKD